MPAHPAPRRLVAALAGLAAALSLAACDLRPETPPPVEPSPDAAEQVRARTVDDALGLAAAARSARTGLADDDPAAAVLDDVVAFSTAHAEAFGGVYESGLPKPTPTVTPTVTPTAAPASPQDVLTDLLATADTALADADADPDGATARLLASVGVSRDDLGTRLSSALGLEPAVESTPVPEPTGVPAGLGPEAATTLVLAHDQAGYAFEVIAAKLTDAPRAAAQLAAAEHREAAQEWLDRSGAEDPRQAVYALPPGLDETTAATLAADLETAVGDAASAAIPQVAAGARSELVGVLASSVARARAWGATPIAFPGIPELG